MPNRILVIDDDVSLRSTILHALRSNGYEAIEAENGEQGLALARFALPSLVICDLHMEGLDGFSVLKALRSEPDTSNAPVILMSGMPETSTLRSSMKLGADDFLAKPFVISELLATVCVRLARHASIQEQSKAEEKRLLEVLSATQDLVGIADPETGRIRYLNTAGRKMLAIEADEDICDFHLADFTPDSDVRPAHLEILDQAKDRGVWLGETELISREGRRIPVSKQILAHRSATAQPSFLSVIARDITQLKAAETERQNMEIQLRQAQKLESIGQLAAGIAHEINTPTQYIGDNTRFVKDAFDEILKALSAYSKALELAKQNALTPGIIAQTEEILASSDLQYLIQQVPGALRETIEGVDRVAKIVRAIKQFAHPGGKEKTPSDLNKAIDTTVIVARNEWKYVADVVYDLDPELPLVACLLGDFNQTILNLIVNAAHAIDEAAQQNPGTKGTITIRTRRDADHVEVRVGDTGTGIPVACRQRIFDPFFTTKEVGKGSGQGLAIVYGCIVKNHAGTVTFETEIGKGTTFVIRLPIHPKTVMPEKRLPNPAHASSMLSSNHQ